MNTLSVLEKRTSSSLMRKALFSVLLLVVILIGLGHFFTPGSLAFYHDTFRRLSYFPIVLGALWFGVRGGFFFAFLSSIAFIPHVLLYIGQSPQTYISELMEIILYLAAGILTGVIAGREARLREQYKILSEKLEKSYHRLHKQAKLLIEVEEQLGASQRLSALGKLSASLAHEIKNPLSSIRGIAEIFLDEFPKNHKKREFAEILVKEVCILTTTVDRVLKFSKGNAAGGRDTEFVSDVIQRVMNLMATHLRKNTIEMDIVGTEQGNDFSVDGAQLSQVLFNIVLNAIDALPQGSGKIKVRTMKKNDGLTVSICDNGHGISRSMEQKIFEPFLTTKEDGTGLGLPISRKILESYGGNLTCGESEEGGACFTIFLPGPESVSEANFLHGETRQDVT